MNHASDCAVNNGPAMEASPCDCQARMGWQPIETAPKDGSSFWGLVGEDALSMLWHPKFEAFVIRWHRMTMAPGYTIDGEPYQDHSPDIVRPVAWMPKLRAPDWAAP